MGGGISFWMWSSSCSNAKNWFCPNLASWHDASLVIDFFFFSFGHRLEPPMWCCVAWCAWLPVKSCLKIWKRNWTLLFNWVWFCASCHTRSSLAFPNEFQFRTDHFTQNFFQCFVTCRRILSSTAPLFFQNSTYCTPDHVWPQPVFLGKKILRTGRESSVVVFRIVWWLKLQSMLYSFLPLDTFAVWCSLWSKKKTVRVTMVRSVEECGMEEN